jgi:alcohol dehydrogenase class IV
VTLRFEAPTRIVAGQGQRHALGESLDWLSAKRAVITCSPRFARTQHYDDVVHALGHSHVGTYDEVTPQSNVREVDALAALIKASDADVVVAIGGGSPMATAKCAVAAVGEGKRLDEIGWSYQPEQGTLRIPELRAPKLPIIALPTTAGSASETNQFGSVKDERTSEKIRIRDPRLTPRVAILDPDLTLSLDHWTTVGTGANAFAHCIEILYSRESNPISDALVLEAADIIYRNLPRCAKDPEDVKARGAMQVATAMSGQALNNSLVCLHHALCHPLGNRASVPHGVANYVMLPHSLRFNQAAAAPQLTRMGTRLGILNSSPMSDEEGARITVNAIEEWLRDLDGPARLRDTRAVAREDLEEIAESARRDTCMYYNPRQVTSVEEILGIYLEAW